MDQQAETAERALALEPGDQVGRQLDPLDGLAQDELTGVQDEGLVIVDPEQLRQVRLRSPDVDERVAVVAEDPEAAVQVEVDRRGLQVARVVRVEADLACLDRGPDVPVGEHAHRARLLSSRVAYRLSTSRFRSARSSNDW